MRAKSSCRALLLAIAALMGTGAAIAQTTPDTEHTRVSLPVDWSYTHMIYSKDRSPDQEAAKPHDKRYIYSRKLHGNGRPAASVDNSRMPVGGKDTLFEAGRFGQNRGQQPGSPAKIDWSFSLGAGFVAPGMYPAKFSFDINQPVTSANCTGTTAYVWPDFVVYGLDVAGVTGGQGNLVALDNLYSGTTPAVGVCGAGGPLVYWSYNTTTVSGGKITTSPVLSEDGSQVAFLESGGATTYLHILNWSAGDGAGSGDAIHAAAPSTIWAKASASATVSDTISAITVTNSGSGYASAPTVTISGGTGGGTGATATSTLNAGVNTVAITTQGSNYASAPTVTFGNPTGPGGVAASGTANVTDGVTSYTVTAGGANYTTTPTVTVQGPGTGTTATATATTATGATSINVTNGGTGYTTAPIITYSSGTGAATANLSQGVGSYTLTNGGSGYATTPTVSITGDGTGATATATFSGSVQSLNLTNAGSGYQTAPTVAFSPTGATATAAIAGPVSTLTLATAGAGYTSAPTVTISAPTSGTTATATANLSTFTLVSGVTFTNHGSYYTNFGFNNPTVTFSCSATGCVQNTAATGTVVTSTSSSTCGATQGFSDVCIASVTINNGGSYTLTGGSVVMTVNYYTKVTAAAYTVNTATTTTLTSLTLNNGGSGYTSNPTVTFTGGGATTQATATAKINGTVQSLTLINPGTYTSAPTVSFTSATGTGAAATATISGSVTAINVTAMGTGYTTATVTINSASGTGAAATANLTGIVGSITVTNPGTYSTAPAITFNNTGTGGSGATATAVLSKYVSAINVTNAGNNYVSAPTVTIGGPGTGAAATANLTGVVSSVTVTSAGSGYTAVPTVTFTSTGSGSGAAGTATISGSVASVTVNNAGSGYTGTPTVTFGSGGGGTGAAATVSTLDQLGAINLVYGGSGYTTVPNVYINGGGAGASGATATANVSAGGVVTSITLTSNGTGYTAAPTVTLDPPSAGCATSGSCMINVAISSNHITNSSPYYDYDSDVLYFGDDSGVLYSVSPVFVGTATTGGTAAPVVTSLQVASTSGQTMLTGPVLDGNSGNVFVGAADGKVYAVPTSFTSVAGSMVVGAGSGTSSCGTASGGIADPVIVDGSISALYAYTQNAATSINSSNRAIVTQAGTGASPSTLFGSRVNNITTGAGNMCGSTPASTGTSVVNVHSPAFDNNYYNGTGVGHLFICDNSTTAAPAIYAITFNAGVMNNAVDATLGLSLSSLATSDYAECAPITEIFQPGSDGGPDGNDYMLLGAGRISGGTGAFGAAVGQAYSVTSSYVMTKGIEHTVNTYPAAQDGISGIVVDNISPVAQASSMYFTTEAVGNSTDPVCGTGKYCAVKLTQSGLQ